MGQRLDRFGQDAAGSIVVEFAFIAPVLLLMLFGIVAFSTLFATMHAVQQLASEAARASVAGISDAERAKIVDDFVKANVRSYVLLDPAKIATSSATLPAQADNYEVTIRYDNSQSFIYMFKGLLPLPPADLQRKSIIVRGGY
ncbi:MAG: pilus assembly protein [Beijerinckiaceae bacterium]|nr:pilus assembly protein [Beijerinckiaceae bacterium]